VLKKYVTIALCVLVVNLASAAQLSLIGKPENDTRFVQKVKTSIAKLGTGPAARVSVKLRNGTKLKGYISEISDDQFVVMDSKTNTAVPIPYPQVKQVKGNNLSTGVTIAIVAAIAVLVIGLVFGRLD
jgi:small nuclear ribonucleoprotein (snRNP)-like protein